MSNQKSSPSLQSRWSAPAPKKKNPQPQSLSETDTWIKSLQKNAASASSIKETGNQHKDKLLAISDTLIKKLQIQAKSTAARKMEKNSAVNTAPNAGAIILDLEESYFKNKPMQNPGMGNSETDRTGYSKSSLRKDLSDKGGKQINCPPVSLPLKEGELSLSSEMTDHHSNRSNTNEFKPKSMVHKAKAGNKLKFSQIGSKKSAGTTTSFLSKAKSDVARCSKESVNTKQVKSDGHDDLARVIAESKKIFSTEVKKEEQFNADMKRALVASKQESVHTWSYQSGANNVVDLADSADEEDAKMPAKGVGNNMTKNESTRTNVNGGEDENAALERAMQLSLEESQNAAQQASQFNESIPLTCRRLTRNEFRVAVDTFVLTQGGYHAIEKGQMVKHGNANRMDKTCIADGGGQNQTGAEYGRYCIRSLDRVFDVLEGNEDIELNMTDMPISSSQKEASRNRSEDGLKRKRGSNSRLEGLPGAEIKGFLDIGHGIGIQVLQAAWSLGVPARGVEIMKDRHLIAELVRDGVLESLRNDPPDSTMVELKLADFSPAVVRDKKTKQRDEELRTFLLFKDRSDTVQRGLVIFINNAEEVFAARSNQRGDGACLDAYLANLFANMLVGGRMVTLTDVSSHLNHSEWFRHDVFESGTHAVSWGNKSVTVHVLTKLSNKWLCQNNGCASKKFRSEDSNDVVDENGVPCEACVYCGARAKRSTRMRKPSRKFRKEEE